MGLSSSFNSSRTADVGENCLSSAKTFAARLRELHRQAQGKRKTHGAADGWSGLAGPSQTMSRLIGLSSETAMQGLLVS